VNTIRPEIIAAKLDAIRQGDGGEICQQALDSRRLPELILFLAWHLDQPGGAKKFAEKCVTQCPAAFGTGIMRDLAAQRAPWTLENKLAVCREIPRQYLRDHEAEEHWLLSTFWKSHRASANFANAPYSLSRPRASEFDDAVAAEDRPRLEEILKDFDAASCQKVCLEAALTDLPGRLVRFCSEPQSPLRAAWYLGDMVNTLIDMMDADAGQAARATVSTQIAREAIGALEYAASSKAMAWIETDGCFLEDDTISAWCAARPGKVRVVDTPSENGDVEWYRALAKAMGFDTGFKTVNAETRCKIVNFAQSSRLLFVFRNAQFLLPSRFTKNTLASRLDWIDTRFLQKRVPIAAVATRSAFESASAKFKSATHQGDGPAPFETWLAQNALKFTLPQKLDAPEFLALAQSRYPDMDALLLKLICAKALQTRFYIADVQKIAGLARFYASAAGREAVSDCDVDAAIAKAIPGAVAAPDPAAPSAPSSAMATPKPKRAIRKCGRTLALPTPAAAPSSALQAPARGTIPVFQTT
jgi:hypothetical protein